MPRFGRRSKERLKGVNSKLVNVLNELIKIMDVTIIEGVRSKQRQSELIEKGFDINGSKSDLIVKMCKAVDADNFVFGSIGRTYMDNEVFKKNDINYYFQNFKHPEYKQMHGDFISHMSSIDLLFNHGKESIKILGKSTGDTE